MVVVSSVTAVGRLARSRTHPALGATGQLRSSNTCIPLTLGRRCLGGGVTGRNGLRQPCRDAGYYPVSAPFKALLTSHNCAVAGVLNGRITYSVVKQPLAASRPRAHPRLGWGDPFCTGTSRWFGICTAVPCATSGTGLFAGSRLLPSPGASWPSRSLCLPLCAWEDSDVADRMCRVCAGVAAAAWVVAHRPPRPS